MPKEIPGTGGFVSYGGDKTAAPPPQTVFPKAQGGVAPTVKKEVPNTGGFTSYGGQKAESPAPPESQNSFLYDFTHPQPADLSRPQTWRDWATKTYDPSAKQIGTAAVDDASFGFADPIQAHFTGENVADIRARTADAQAALGPGAPIVNALTYAVPGGGVAKGAAKLGITAGKSLARNVGRYGAGAVEGGVTSGASSYGHQAFDPEHPVNLGKLAKDTAIGTAGGIGSQAIGDTIAAVSRPIADYVTGKGGRGSERWNWRERAARSDADRESVRAEIAGEQALRPPNDPAQPALAKTQAALGQSVEPGRMADAVYGTTGGVASYLGLPPDYQLLGAGFGGLTAGGVAKSMLGSPGAKAINTIDRNINVGQAFDQLYPALYGRKSTTDTSGWADALRRLTVGADRPGPPGAQLW